MTELLTPKEIATLTGKLWSRHQALWLAEQGIPHRVDGNLVSVFRTHMRAWLEGRDVSKEPPPASRDWRDYILKPDATKYDLVGDHPTSVIGIYGLYSGDELLYIGKSTGVCHRIYAHKLAMRRGAQANFGAYCCLEVPLEMLADVEKAHIAALYPPRNFTLVLGALCGWHDDMVAAIKKTWNVVEIDL